MYDAFLRDWQDVLATVGEELGVTWPGMSHRATIEIESFLSEQHRHHVFDWRELEGRADVVSWVKETYFALRNSSPLSILDQVRDELSRADTAFGPIVEEERRALRASEAQLVEAAAARDAMAEEVEVRGATLEARGIEMQQLQGELAQPVAASDERIAARQVEVDTLRAQRDGFAREVEVLAGELARLASTVEAAQSQAIAAEGQAASAREELAATRTQQDSLRAQAQSAASRAAAIEADSIAERDRLLTRLEAARANADELGGRLAAANAALGALEARAALERGELLERIREADAALERLSAQALAAESEASAERKRMLSDLDIARSEAHGLALELGARSREVNELASVADELLLAADAELAGLRGQRERLQSELADKLEAQGQLLIVLDHLEGALESATAKLGEHEQTADSFARNSAAQREEFEAERTRLVTELEAARADLGRARSEIEIFHSELGTTRGQSQRLVADLETARSQAARLTASAAHLEEALKAQRALNHAVQSVTRRRTPRRRSLSQVGTWLLPPTPRKLNYLRQYLVLRFAGNFDVDAYLLANPDVLAAGINPMMHYVEYGRAEGRQPSGIPQQLAESVAPVAAGDNAAIDEEGVAELPATGPSAEHAGEAPADAAAGAGDADGTRSLRASDHPAEGIAEAEASATTTMLTDEVRAELDGDFDSDYYRGTYDDIDHAEIDPLEHYFYTGWREGRDPSAAFSTSYYLSSNPDVAAEGINPLVHYVVYGRAEGRQPSGIPQQLAESVAPVAAGDNAAIDEEGVAELPATGPSAEHAGEAPADAAAGAGDADGTRSLRASDHPAEGIVVAEASATTTMLTDEVRAELDGDFDSDYYRGTYDDIDRAEIDPLEHYFYTGWREGRDPSAAFSTSYYLSSNPDVAAEGINPLVHYVLAGRREGRRPYPATGFRGQTLQTLRSLEEEIGEWERGTPALEASVDGISLTAALSARIGTRTRVVVSCSHDNYTKVVGGAQLCLALEQEAFVEDGCAYINLHPARPLPVFSSEMDPEALDLCVLCDGESVGSTSASTVIAALSDIRSNDGIDFGLVVHALHGHSPEVVAQLHHDLAPQWAWLWLHDFFGICPNAQLLRNRIEPCGAPPPESPGCMICIFGEERLGHLPRFRHLLKSVPFNLVAPSQFMAHRWKSYFGDDQLAITVHENGQVTVRLPGSATSVRCARRLPGRRA